MEKSSLTDRVRACQQTGEGREELEREIVLLAYDYMYGNRRLTEDEAGDYFCKCYTKILELIDSFTYQGKPFEAYLFISLRWYILHYKRKGVKEKLSWTVFSHNSFWEVDQYEPFYGPEGSGIETETLPELNTTSKRRLVYLALRESEYLTHSMVEEIVSATHIDRRWFLNCVMALKEKIEKRHARLEAAKRYRNRYFYRYHMLQLLLQQCPDPKNRGRIQTQLEEIKRKLDHTAERIRGMHVHPTNREISEVLKVPKGTIDSGIYYLINTQFDNKENEAA